MAANTKAVKTKAVEANAAKPTSRKRKADVVDNQPDISTKKPARKVAKVCISHPIPSSSYTHFSQGPYNVDKQQGKPDPIGQPIVWSLGRQGLCESLPYYRNYQKGAYTSGGRVYGILLSAEVGLRDKFNEDVIITTT